MKKVLVWRHIYMLMLLMTGVFAFTSCDDDDDNKEEPTPVASDLYGNYKGTMNFTNLSSEGTSTLVDLEPTTSDVVEDSVASDTIYFKDFPIKSIVASMMGDQLAEAIVQQVGKVEYHFGYKPTLSEKKDSFMLALNPDTLHITWNGQAIKVAVKPVEGANYECKTGNMKFGLVAEEVKIGTFVYPTFTPMQFDFDMKKN